MRQKQCNSRPRLQSEWRRHQQRSLQATSGAAEPSPAAPPSSSPASIVVPPVQEDLRCVLPCLALCLLFVWGRQLCGQPQRQGTISPAMFNAAAAPLTCPGVRVPVCVPPAGRTPLWLATCWRRVLA